MLALWLTLARAESIAVVDFYAWDVSSDDATRATDGVRTALLEAGDLDPLPGSDIADGVSAAAESELRAARGHAAEARRAYLQKDDATAISTASAAIAEHDVALSHVGRRAEFADAWFLLGLACTRIGLTDDAQDAFAHVAALYPRYLEERAVDTPAAARTLLEAAQADAAHTRLSRQEVDQVRDALDVDWVVTGSLDAEGNLLAQVWGADADDVRLYAEVRSSVGAGPAPDMSPAYASIAAEIVRRAVVKVAAQVEPEPEEEQREKQVVRSDTLTKQWWFWTAAAAVVGGGGSLGTRSGSPRRSRSRGATRGAFGSTGCRGPCLG